MMDIPEAWEKKWKSRSTQIVLVELIAPLIALYTWRPFLMGRTVLLFNDSTTAENILIKGYSNAAADANAVVHEFWRGTCELQSCLYIDRVPTDGNPSDGCSRGKACEDAMLYGWELCRAKLHETWLEHGPGMMGMGSS